MKRTFPKMTGVKVAALAVLVVAALGAPAAAAAGHCYPLDWEGTGPCDNGSGCCHSVCSGGWYSETRVLDSECKDLAESPSFDDDVVTVSPRDPVNATCDVLELEAVKSELVATQGRLDEALAMIASFLGMETAKE